ncbi:hypothetical protein [Rhodococcus pyridinivorans]|uniref:Uncharacterized protein n=1 Tax=Rhodococcus pyridinivorans TaxID=103816 RepID=A0A7M2XIF7_9NOCA|nr:hypothetical protein [Rhodococcus pyridinivorans]QOV97193.1 hypothetical protein INP59_14550 [Rhodococcus pyridinivorans]
MPNTTSAATHIRKAEELLEIADRDVSLNWPSMTGEHKADILAAAQVHATLALALGSLGFPGGMPWSAGGVQS